MANPIVGHDAVRSQLRNAITSARMPHAWILHGQQGIGKSLLAQEMAQEFLCTARNGDGQPCAQCHSCRMMLADTHPDFRALAREEGKRDIPVHAIRTLLAFLILSGNESERRAVIINDADHLNKAAANALLKGLEEPTSGCLLILVVHDLQRLPATVRSRAVLQRCHALNDRDMRTVLTQMNFDATLLGLALQAGQGRPGRIVCLQPAKDAKLLHQWQQATEHLEEIDIGQIQQLLASKWPIELLQLAIELLLERLYHLIPALPVATAEQVLQLAWELAEMPKRIAHQKLAPDMALLGLLIALRKQLRHAPNAAIANPHNGD
ncbi:MAG: DNA polymerase III subunit [Mariprofundales bacterium]|nr:DNA polymerase III subunit [Mariprofundales bacterium]